MILTVICDVCIVFVYYLTAFYPVWCIGWCITLNGGSLCVFLALAPNKWAYELLCNQCDGCCKILCDKFTEKAIERTYNEQRVRLQSVAPSLSIQDSDINEQMPLKQQQHDLSDPVQHNL